MLIPTPIYFGCYAIAICVLMPLRASCSFQHTLSGLYLQLLSLNAPQGFMLIPTCYAIAICAVVFGLNAPQGFMLIPTNS